VNNKGINAFYVSELELNNTSLQELEMALIESGVPASHWNMADLPGLESDMAKEEICEMIKSKVSYCYIYLKK